MWVNNSSNWADGLMPLEKFLTEKIIQRCDAKESITNKHRTTNGYTQLKELINLSVLSKSRSRTIRTVKILLLEAKSDVFTQNIANDIIINEYFKDLKDFVLEFDASKLTIDSNQPNLNALNDFIHKLQIFESQLEKNYFHCLSKEFFKIDYMEMLKIERSTRQISRLVDILIPFLVFEGYAISSLSEVLKSWIEKKYKATAKRVFRFFNFTLRTFDYLIKLDTEVDSDFETIIPLIVDYTKVDLTIGVVGELEKGKSELGIFDKKTKVLIYSHDDLDPHIHFRGMYDGLLKNLVMIRERQSLSVFNSLLSSCYWRLPKKGKEYHHVQLVNDPINVNSRGQTLRETLINCSLNLQYEFGVDSNIPIPKNSQIGSSLYYYNLALGSKSIENSLSLLWTSLESILPYRVHYSDVDCVQELVSKTLAIGSLVRDIHSFGKRVHFTSNENQNAFDSLFEKGYPNCSSKQGIIFWYKWLTDMTEHQAKFDLFKRHSELLAFEYSRIAKPLVQGKLGDVKNRILLSHESIRFQVQRIYLHRNQIIHAGNLINEYTNLWMHLEWYVGKLLAIALIKVEINRNCESLDEVFISIQADFDYVMSYLEMNRSKPIAELSSRVKETLLEYYWQSY